MRFIHIICCYVFSWIVMTRSLLFGSPILTCHFDPEHSGEKSSREISHYIRSDTVIKSEVWQSLLLNNSWIYSLPVCAECYALPKIVAKRPLLPGLQSSQGWEFLRKDKSLRIVAAKYSQHGIYCAFFMLS